MNASYSAWPRFDLRHTFLSFTKSAGSVSVAGPLKLRWFSHPIQYYLHVPNVSIYRWSSNFVNLSSCWIEKGAISSNLPCVFIV